MPTPKKKTKPGFDPKILDRSTIALPLLADMRAIEKGEAPDEPLEVILDVNLDFHAGRDEAQKLVVARVEALTKSGAAARRRKGEVLHAKKTALSRQYVFASLRGKTILDLVAWDKKNAAEKRGGAKKGGASPPSNRRTIYRIWPDFEVEARTSVSIATVKADAAHRSFEARGDGVVWAVIDSGISAKHPHFAKYKNLELPDNLKHQDFTSEDDKKALVDEFGHGTHVAGIIAGEGQEKHRRAALRQKEDDAEEESVRYESRELSAISGMAPKCKLLSLKALDKDGRGRVSNIISALATIQEANGHGRRFHVHGVNLSVGYDFDAEWFACGQSPLCVEVDRLVKSGVVVVVAAGNTGYGDLESQARGTVKAPMALSINDPGNAELAITVGATHREAPHIYGVSYFSSKGPTGDGRAKPDLVAPGEKILSCAAGGKLDRAKSGLGGRVDYLEDSGTSMAAPHVSGVIAAFLSVRREFIGRAEAVKDIFCRSATDLKRQRYFQGHGLVDLMRAIQSV